MDTGTSRDIGQNIAHFYGKFFHMSNRRWKMRGLVFTDLRKGTLDLSVMEKAFAACKGEDMPSDLVAHYLLFAQVCTIKRVMFGREARGTHFFDGIHAQEIYDKLTIKSLGFHKRVIGPDGEFKKTFIVNPATCLNNMVTRCIKDVMYDLYRYDIEMRNNKAGARMRPMDMRAKLARSMQFCDTHDLRAWMDTIGMDPFEGPEHGVVPCQ